MRYVNMYPEEKQMAKKKIIPKWDWKKFIEGARRPAIALIVAGFVAWGFDNELSGIVAALIVERGISSVVWLINKK